MLTLNKPIPRTRARIRPLGGYVVWSCDLMTAPAQRRGAIFRISIYGWKRSLVLSTAPVQQSGLGWLADQWLAQQLKRRFYVFECLLSATNATHVWIRELVHGLRRTRLQTCGRVGGRRCNWQGLWTANFWVLALFHLSQGKCRSM